MAGELFGIKWNSPMEIQRAEMAKLDQEMEAARQSGDRGREQGVRMRQIALNLVGTPESRQAHKVDKVMKAALDDNPKQEGESAAEHQIRVLNSARDGVASISPQQAIQINEQIIRLRDAVQSQRSKELDIQADELQAQYDRGLVIADANGQAASDVFWDDNIKENYDAAHAAMQEMRQSNPDRELFIKPLAKMVDWDPSRGRSGSDNWTASDEKTMKGINANTGLMLETANLVETLNENMWGLVPGASDTAVAIDTVGNNINAVEGWISGSVNEAYEKAKQWAADNRISLTWSSVDEYKEQLDKEFEDTFDSATREGGEYSQAWDDMVGALRKAGKDSSYLKAQVKLMAYSLAKALDPGGRLSDQDVEMAMEMIIGNGSPEVIEKRIRERIRTTDYLLQPLLAAAEAGNWGGRGKDEARIYREAKLAAEEAVRVLTANYTGYRDRYLEGIQMQHEAEVKAQEAKDLDKWDSPEEAS